MNKARKLTNLAIVGIDIDASGLANVGKCRSLEYLEINGIPVTDENLQPTRTMKQLRTLKLHDTNASDAFIAALKTALPKVKIEVSGKRP